MSIDTFSNQFLQKLKDCLFWFIQIKMIIQEVIKKKGIIHKNILSRITTSSSTEKSFMTNH